MAALDAASLQQLRDIHLPEAEAWWHLPWGVYALLGLMALLVVLAVALWRPVRRRYQTKQRKQHLQHIIAQEMHRIESLAQDDAHAIEAVAQLSTLLRRVAMSLCDARHVEGLIGQDWVDFLESQWRNTPQPSFATPEVQEVLLHTAYRADIQDAEMDAIQTCVRLSRQWMEEMVVRDV